VPASRDALLSAADNRRMFGRIAARYDRANVLLSLGLDRGWRRRAVEALGPRSGLRYLDVGCGTGEMTRALLRQAPGARVIGIDPVEAMLALAVGKARKAGRADAVEFVAADAEALPFPQGAFAGVVSAFCIRNIADRRQALREMRRVLVPGGRLVVLEASVPTSRALRLGHRLYTRRVLPLLGGLVAGSRGAYRYLAESIEAFPEPSAVVQMIAGAGFAHAESRSLSGGIVTLYTAVA